MKEESCEYHLTPRTRAIESCSTIYQLRQTGESSLNNNDGAKYKAKLLDIFKACCLTRILDNFLQARQIRQVSLKRSV